MSAGPAVLEGRVTARREPSGWEAITEAFCPPTVTVMAALRPEPMMSRRPPPAVLPAAGLMREMVWASAIEIASTQSSTRLAGFTRTDGRICIKLSLLLTTGFKGQPITKRLQSFALRAQIQ